MDRISFIYLSGEVRTLDSDRVLPAVSPISGKRIRPVYCQLNGTTFRYDGEYKCYKEIKIATPQKSIAATPQEYAASKEDRCCVCGTGVVKGANFCSRDCYRKDRRACKTCAAFVSSNFAPYKDYCSVACYNKDNPILSRLVCQNCNKNYIYDNSKSPTPKQFCSFYCYKADEGKSKISSEIPIGEPELCIQFTTDDFLPNLTKDFSDPAKGKLGVPASNPEASKEAAAILDKPQAGLKELTYCQFWDGLVLVGYLNIHQPGQFEKFNGKLYERSSPGIYKFVRDLPRNLAESELILTEEKERCKFGSDTRPSFDVIQKLTIEAIAKKKGDSFHEKIKIIDAKIREAASMGLWSVTIDQGWSDNPIELHTLYPDFIFRRVQKGGAMNGYVINVEWGHVRNSLK
jgi:hypothetical protein